MGRDTESEITGRCPWEIVPGTDDGQEQKDAELIREAFKVIPNFFDVIRSLMEAMPFGFACPEIT